MLLQPITIQFSKSTLKPSVYTLKFIFLSAQSIMPLNWVLKSKVAYLGFIRTLEQIFMILKSCFMSRITRVTSLILVRFCHYFFYLFLPWNAEVLFFCENRDISLLIGRYS